MQTVLDIGDRCCFCGADTSAGMGLYVDRIPAYTDASNAEDWLDGADNYLYLNGWMCRDCQKCDEPNNCYHEECSKNREEVNNV